MKRLARRLHRRFRSRHANTGRKRTTRATRIEQLEPRQMMAADGLAFAQSSIGSANTLNTIPFVVEGNSQPVAISFHVLGTGGTLDPAALVVQTSAGVNVPAMFSTEDYAGTNDSVLIVELAAGSYRIVVGGEAGTTGTFDLHAGLPGDTSGDGQVSKTESQYVTAAILQSHMGFTNVSAQVFKKLGIDVSKNLYKPELDINSNGKLDSFDQSIIDASVGASPVELEFMVDDVGPTITGALVGDTGRSNTDGITNNLSATINGTLSDEMPIASFTASIDGSTAVDLATLLGQSFTNGGNFSITRQQLEQIAGNVSVVNNGSHTLLLSARDQQGNLSTRQVTFQFDTIAPAAPTALDLDSSTDTGSSNSDNITRLQQLQLRANAESNAIVQFFSSLDMGSIGQATASPATITTGTLAEGTHNITATATDVAGNVSSSSAVLAVTIDTTAPAVPEFDLDLESDTGTDGDHLTTLSSVTFEGTTTAGAAVELRRGGVAVATATANGSGEFSFNGVTLPFGASSFVVVATDTAGNSVSSPAESYTRNTAPVVDEQQFAVDENSAAGTVVATVVANDADSGEGDTLTYSIVGGNTSGAFAINASTGQITVANPAALNFEANPTFSLTVRVTDHGGVASGGTGTGLFDEATVTINLNGVNEAPVVNNQGFTIAENAAGESVVGTVASSDPDAGDTRTYAITGGNTSGAFAINAQTGVITVVNSAALDYETVANHAFLLTVSVTDAGMLADTATVTVTLTDANDRPTAQSQMFNASAKFDDGHVIGTVVAQDQDAGDSLEYEIESSNAPEGVFSINAGTGAVSVTNANLLTEESYSLTVQVTDEAGATLVTPITITINVTANIPPEAKDDDRTINEDASAIDISVLADNGHGADSDADDPVASLIISGFDATSEHGATISLQPDGVLRYDPTNVPGRNALAVGQTIVDTFTYTIKDPDNGTSTATVTVTITGVNDDPTAKNDALMTDEDTSVTFDPRIDHGNGVDSDPDTGDVLTVTAVSGTSAQGATVTLANGQITYNPLTSAALQALEEFDEPIVDTFTYTISDGKGGTSMATVSITVSGIDDIPSMAAIADQNVFAGAPLLIPLNGIDPDSNGVAFFATSENGDLLQPIVYGTSRSLSITLAGYGEMRFYLFEELVPGITQNIINLVEAGELDNTIFHRLIEGFVAQGLDPTGTGRGHFGLPDFDDQYHTDLQHTGSGYLSMAKAGDDTNGQQIFITDYRPGFVIESGGVSDQILRNLDFNHSVFGRLTVGESIRQAIMGVAVGSGDRPLVDLVIEDIRIVQDEFNAVLMLKAPNGMTGSTEVTVTVRDGDFNESSQTFDVTVAQDPYNGRPFLGPVPASLTTTVGQPVVVNNLTAVDDEGDAVTFSAIESPLPRKVLFDNAGDEAGVTPAGTGGFTYRGMTWSGGVVVAADTSLLSSGTAGYDFGSDGEIVLATASPDVSFFFTHGSGVAAGTATAYDAGGNVVETWDSKAATEFNDWHNFASYSAERDQFGNIVGPRITRIEFTGGLVDNFEASIGVTVGLTVTVDNVNDTVTITPPAGFVGRMDVMIRVSSVNASTGDSIRFDTQVIPITVLPAAPLTAAEGGSGQAASAGTIGDDDPLLNTAFQSGLATWQSILGLAELPDIQLNVADLGGALLGSTAIVSSGDMGLPTSSVITIDDDGAGHGWHTSVDQSVAADRYDLYTVLMHEVGHALGFHAAAEALGLSESALGAYFDDYGHLLGDADDLMSDVLGLGERRLPSALDVNILQLAYGIDDGDSSARDAALAVWS